jgi:hypothetical protein
MYGNFQILPSPIAEPAAAASTPNDEPNVSRFVINPLYSKKMACHAKSDKPAIVPSKQDFIQSLNGEIPAPI